MKTFRVLSFNEKGVIQKRFEANIVWFKDNIYSLELVNFIESTDPDTGETEVHIKGDNTTLVRRQYIIDDSTFCECKYILNSDYKIHIEAKDKRMFHYLKDIPAEQWMEDETREGKYCYLEDILLELVQTPRKSYCFPLTIKIDCCVYGEESEAASIAKVLERLNEGDLPAFIPLPDRYNYKLILEIPDEEEDKRYMWIEVLEYECVKTYEELIAKRSVENEGKIFFCHETELYYFIYLKEDGYYDNEKIENMAELPELGDEWFNKIVRVNNKFYKEVKKEESDNSNNTSGREGGTDESNQG